MDVIRANRLIAAILGGLVVMALVVILLKSGNGPSEPSLSTSDVPLRTPTAAASAQPELAEFPRPNIKQLACEPLLAFDDVDPVLGSTIWLTFGRGESCTHRLIDDGDVFVRIWPGRPSDLIDGGILDGTAGRPVAGIGQAAAWFGDESTLSVGTESAFGILISRVTVSAPDLEEGGRLEAAQALARSALPRFPGVVIEPAPQPEEVTVTFENPALDRSAEDFVENLLAREADGDWSRGEGLVATLRYFAGEIEATEVLRGPELLDDSGTGIVRLARGYLAGSAEAESVVEIERLLQLLLVREPKAVTTAAEASAAGGRFRSMAVFASQEADDGICYSVYPDHEDPCFKISSVDFPQFGDKYVLWFPKLDDGEEWQGWKKGESTIQDAIIKSAAQLESISGSMPKVAVWLTPYEGGRLIDIDAGVCSLMLNSGAQALRDQNPDFLQQAIASALARCYISWNFGVPGGALLDWWESAFSWYLSDVIYPDVQMEVAVLGIPQSLASKELSSTVTERSVVNMTFFEYLDGARGLEGTIEAVGTIAESGLGDISGIEDLLHEYTKALTDGVILDRAGAHAYGPPSDFQSLTEGVTISAEPQPFGVERVRVDVSGSDYACLEYPDAGNLDIIVSWREGSPGESGSWSTALPASVQGEGVFLLTTTEPGGQFRIKVRAVDDEEGCPEEEEPNGDDPGEPCGFCDRTSFYYDSFQEWLSAAGGLD